MVNFRLRDSRPLLEMIADFGVGVVMDYFGLL